jgi:zinc/manganese transport system substrate-binding protein
VVASGCASLGSPARAAGVRVVAAERTWGSIATTLAGRYAAVTSIISNPAVDPHSYEPEAADARAFAQARVVIVNGLGYDTWASQLLAADTPAGRRTINVGATLGLGAGSNPHRWYSPPDVLRIADALTGALIAAAPQHRAYFTERHRYFVTTELGRYFAAIRAIRTRASGSQIGASETIVVPIASALGLRILTPGRLMRAVSDGAEISSADLAAAHDQITHHRIRVWVLNPQNSIPAIAQLTDDARAAGIPVVEMTETPAPVSATFGAWQSGQLITLARALGVGDTT